MKCRQCGNENTGVARYCSKCGTALGTGSVLDRYGSDLENPRKDFLTQLDATRASIDAQIAQFKSPALGTPAMGAQAVSKGPIHPMELIGLLIPLPDQIVQSKEIALSSPFIHGNAQYHARIESTSFRYLAEDMTVNAFATDYPIPVGDGEELKPPAIAFLGGLAMVLRITAAALAVYIRPQSNLRFLGGESSLIKAFHAIGDALVQGGGKLDPEVFGDTLMGVVPTEILEDDRFVGLARSLSAAMEAAVIAHEAGHLALGHTLGQRLNFDVSRNQEREADSFASSILTSSPFREYLFLGQIFITIVFSWMEHAARRTDPTTHPLGRERFFNALTNNSAAAKEAADQFGLTRERLIELLPAEDAQALNLRLLRIPDLLH